MSWSGPDMKTSSTSSAEDEYSGKIEEDTTSIIISHLSEDEKECLANSSYKYFKICKKLSTETKSNDRFLEHEKQQLRKKVVEGFASRYLIAEKMKVKSAIDRLKSTVKFRKEMEIDDLRLCFDEKESNVKIDNLCQMLLSQCGDCPPCMYIFGYDYEGRACVVADGSITPEKFEHVKWLKWHLYIAERALACAERKSGQDEFCIIYDYKNYSKKNTPPMSIAKEVIMAFQTHYPERLHVVYGIDVPYIFRAFYKLVSIFIDPETRSKIRFITGNAEKEKMLKEYISRETSLSFMCPDNIEGGLEPLMKVKKFFDIPFDYAYGEENPVQTKIKGRLIYSFSFCSGTF